ncbi:MAG: HAD family hydrolase [Acidobacteria bacterium]|nr:MAG: HAD family hydrolase [Acidobacteriota bacterium]
MPSAPDARAVFLDRDGTIIREVNHLRDRRQLRLLPRAADGIRAFNRLGYRVIVITNQPVVARGWVSEVQLQSIHRTLLERLARRGARLDAIYYCPHHPDANLARYRVRCRCRKPGTALIRRAMRRFGIRSERSFMVGDGTRDMLAGRRAGLTTVLVGTGYAGRDGSYEVRSDYGVRDLREAARLVRRLERQG